MDYKKVQRLFGKPHPVNPWRGKNQKNALYVAIGLLLICAAYGIKTTVQMMSKRRKPDSKDYKKT